MIMDTGDVNIPSDIRSPHASPPLSSLHSPPSSLLPPVPSCYSVETNPLVKSRCRN